MAESHKCDERCRPYPKDHSIQTLYRRLKQRLVLSLRARLYKGPVVRQGKKATHKCSRAEGGFYGPSKVQGPVSKPNSVSCYRQLYSSSLHKQTRRNPLGRDVENYDLVPSLPDNLKSQTHSRVSECDGRTSVQVEPSPVNRMVTASAGVQTDLSQVGHSSCRSVCTHLNHKVPLYVSPVPDQNAWDIDALNINWSGLTAYAYPPMALLHRMIQKIRQSLRFYSNLFLVPKPHQRWRPVIDLSMLNIRDALVLGPGAALNRHPTSTSSVKSSSQTVPQLCVSQQSKTSQPPRLVSRSGQLQEQGFSVEVAERIAAPQRSSTRTIYKSKWALFEKCCRENSVDFSAPSVKQVSDFFMYLYQDLNRHPSTIDGYRTAIVYTLGPAGLHISQSSDLNRLLSSFHRDRPKSSRNLPKWNLSALLNELTKSPFEPMKDTDLKHLTLKTTLLLALASGKRRNEIHAWVANKVFNLNLDQWEKVALFHSSDFIAKNQLAREGSLL